MQTEQHYRLRLLNPIREALVACGIWILIAASIIVGAAVWQAGGFASFYQQADIAGFLGGLLGQFSILAVFLTIYCAWRLRNGVTRTFLTDWRFWALCLILAAWFAGKKSPAPIVGWFVVCAIYQNRENKRRASL